MRMYFIALVLPPHLDEKVRTLKNRMKEKYGCMVALKSPAHITLVPPFWMDPAQEDVLRQDIDRLSGIQSFQIETKKFAAFPPGTLYIEPEPNPALNALKNQVDAYFSDSRYPMKIDNRPFHPHITIATRDLRKKDFAAEWPLLQCKTFEYTWVAEGISLLRHNKKNWDVIYTSQFHLSESDRS